MNARLSLVVVSFCAVHFGIGRDERVSVVPPLYSHEDFVITREGG
jgi:hypothetical protein